MEPQVSDQKTFLEVVTVLGPETFGEGSSLHIYSLRSQHDTATNAPVTNFWWSDKKHEPGYGGFYSLTECLNHYKATMAYEANSQGKVLQWELTPQTIKSNVVAVDFRNRHIAGQPMPVKYRKNNPYNPKNTLKKP